MSVEAVIPYYCAGSAFCGFLVVTFLIDYDTHCDKKSEENQSLRSNSQQLNSVEILNQPCQGVCCPRKHEEQRNE